MIYMMQSFIKIKEGVIYSMEFNKQEFEKLIHELIEKEELGKIIFSSLTKKDGEKITKSTIKPLLIKENLFYQNEYFQNNKAYHKNLEKNEVEPLILKIYENYKNINIIARDKDYAIMYNKGRFHLKITSKMHEEIKITQHNKKKEYIIEEGTPVEFLVDLGIMDKEGKVIKNSYNKFRQINKYLEFIESVIEELQKKKLINNQLKIIDFGSGKSYLTFVLYYYLHEMRKISVEIIGIDLKKDVMENCSFLAKKYRFENMKFIYGDIKNYEGYKEVDIVFSLHACDTATDYSFLKALDLNAKAILAVPCCQHEFSAKISKSKETGLKKKLSPLISHGILQEKLSSLLTDGFRANVLELCGYRAKVLEFIDTEHTPKNLLIKAIRDNGMTEGYLEKKREECEIFMKFMGIEPFFYDSAKKYFK